MAPFPASHDHTSKRSWSKQRSTSSPKRPSKHCIAYNTIYTKQICTSVCVCVNVTYHIKILWVINKMQFIYHLASTVLPLFFKNVLVQWLSSCVIYQFVLEGACLISAVLVYSNNSKSCPLYWLLPSVSGKQDDIGSCTRILQ